MRYFVRFSYKGTDFHGSQTQKNGITVQEVMEQAFTTLLREPIQLVFAGRTDAGVHAKEMWAHWDIGTPDTDAPLPMSCSQLTARLNNLLPHSIAINSIMPVAADAHARFSALRRTYEYHITTRKNPFLYGFATRVAAGLDYDLMNTAAQELLGTHDFASFCKVHTDVKTTLCTIHKAHWEVYDTEAVFTICADRFLRNMVRAVVGTLWQVGRRQIDIEQFKDIIAARNRCSAGQSAPPEGLYLTRVEYPDDIVNS